MTTYGLLIFDEVEELDYDGPGGVNADKYQGLQPPTPTRFAVGDEAFGMTPFGHDGVGASLYVIGHLARLR